MKDYNCRHVLRFVFVLPIMILIGCGLSFAANGTLSLEAACPSCEDNDECTIDSCDTATGTCRHDPSNCDDNNPCTVDFCGFDVGGPRSCGHTFSYGLACNDGNPCTQGDVCQQVSQFVIGCKGTLQPAGATCDDGNACTTSDTCDETGQCLGTSASVGSPCDDLSLCTSEDTCVPSPNGPPTCAGSVKNCADGDLCSQDLCDPATGECGHPAVNCNDGNTCTSDSCDPATGQCARGFLTGSCTDRNLCTTTDACSAGNCLPGPPKNCTDPFSCTNDLCFPNTGCLSFPDDSLCPSNTACAVWKCNQCSNLPGYCTGGCQNLLGPATKECDGNPCTILDQCIRSSCFPGSSACHDNNPCTNDVCDPATVTCSFPNNTLPCSDGNACTTGDVCSNGTCQSGTSLNCDDGSACTADTCTGTGCAHADITASCNDGNPCTTDSCDPASGCVHHPVTSQITCGVGACQRTLDTCVDGVPQTCTPGAPSAEVCNGIDDDCDGLTDENRVQADCAISPSTFNLNSQGGSVSLTCKLLDVCDPANPAPISGSTVGQVYVSRLDSADDPGDDVTLPDPATLPCPDPVLGFLYERGISENLAARDVSNANVTFKFNVPADGYCGTLDGNRQDVAARLAAVPDNTSATICISGKAAGADFQACVLVLVKNKGLR